MLNLTVKRLDSSYLWYQGRTAGAYSPDWLMVVDLAAGRRTPKGIDWRISEQELLRWLIRHNLWIYEPDPEMLIVIEPDTIPRRRPEQYGTVVEMIEPPNTGGTA